MRKGSVHSLETHRKISEALKGHHPSAETRKKISEALKGREGHHLSAETRKKMSEALKGKRRSLETRQKMSASKKGALNPQFGLKGELNPNYKGDDVGNRGRHIRMKKKFPIPDGMRCEICGENPAEERMSADAALLPPRDEYVILGCKSCNGKHRSGELSITFVNPDDGKSYCVFKGEVIEVGGEAR